MNVRYDVVVIGGGFYGCSIAEFFKTKERRVLLVERKGTCCRERCSPTRPEFTATSIIPGAFTPRIAAG